MILRSGDPKTGSRQRFATEAAALALAEAHRLAAPRLLAVDLDGAAAEILDGWRQASGQAADTVSYWDLVAALTTRPTWRDGCRWPATTAAPTSTPRR